MARVISIVSGKGGVGKTTVACYLSRALSKLNKRVLVIDGDYSLNNLDITFGTDCNPNYDLSDFLQGRCRLKQALISDPVSRDVMILTSDRTPVGANGTEYLKAGLTSFLRVFDYILIDAPAGIDEGFLRAVDVSNEALVVTTPYPPSLRDADKVISLLEGNKIDKISVLVNRARPDLMIDGRCFSVLQIQDLLCRKIVGVIPEDDALLTSNGGDIKKHTRAYKALLETAKNIDTGKIKITPPKVGFSGLLGNLKKGGILNNYDIQKQ
ncbi:MAG: AAA family ATPase [Clostridia bacterium]|nr:AAA family ATPase [Clostridia bacterium]